MPALTTNIRRAARLALLAPFVVTSALISRQRLLRLCLAGIYFAVVTPVALWKRRKAGGELRGWWTGQDRQGWHDIDLADSRMDMYGSER
jgi:hypothetical protein